MKRLPVVAGLIRVEGKILLARRPENKKRGGLWELPGGKVEEGEPLEEALARELAEELGIKVKVERSLTQIEYDYPDVSVCLFCFACKIVEGKPHPLEGQELGWFLPEEIETLALAPADFLLWQEVKEIIPLQS